MTCRNSKNSVGTFSVVRVGRNYKIYSLIAEQKCHILLGKSPSTVCNYRVTPPTGLAGFFLAPKIEKFYADPTSLHFRVSKSKAVNSPSS